jgi:hypothetical protein
VATAVKIFSMAYFLCILTLCLTQALWLSSMVPVFSSESGCSADCVSAPGESLEASAIEPEIEIEETEFIGHASRCDVDANRPQSLHMALSLQPVPCRPVDARGSRPPPPVG